MKTLGRFYEVVMIAMGKLVIKFDFRLAACLSGTDEEFTISELAPSLDLSFAENYYYLACTNSV